jgi:hypothetical protein
MALNSKAYVSKSFQDKPNMTQPSAAILNDRSPDRRLTPLLDGARERAPVHTHARCVSLPVIPQGITPGGSASAVGGSENAAKEKGRAPPTRSPKQPLVIFCTLAPRGHVCKPAPLALSIDPPGSTIQPDLSCKSRGARSSQNGHDDGVAGLSSLASRTESNHTSCAPARRQREHPCRRSLGGSPP